MRPTIGRDPPLPTPSPTPNFSFGPDLFLAGCGKLRFEAVWEGHEFQKFAEKLMDASSDVEERRFQRRVKNRAY